MNICDWHVRIYSKQPTRLNGDDVCIYFCDSHDECASLYADDDGDDDGCGDDGCGDLDGDDDNSLNDADGRLIAAD